MNPSYRHTQTGKVVLISLGAVIVYLFLMMSVLPQQLVLIFLGILALVAFVFGSLTVEVDDANIRCWFGPGWIRKTFPLQEVTNVESVRNRWYYGWGIRWVGTGWMYNVSGLDAVEITLKSGRRFRIGTDEPEELESAIWRGMNLEG